VTPFGSDDCFSDDLLLLQAHATIPVTAINTEKSASSLKNALREFPSGFFPQVAVISEYNIFAER
jgi:hypothetical protein